MYHLVRHGAAYMRKEEDAYAQQVRDRLEKQLKRRARELGYLLNKIQSETLTLPDGEVITVTPTAKSSTPTNHDAINRLPN